MTHEPTRLEYLWKIDRKFLVRLKTQFKKLSGRFVDRYLLFGRLPQISVEAAIIMSLQMLQYK